MTPAESLIAQTERHASRAAAGLAQAIESLLLGARAKGWFAVAIVKGREDHAGLVLGLTTTAAASVEPTVRAEATVTVESWGPRVAVSWLKNPRPLMAWLKKEGIET